MESTFGDTSRLVSTCVGKWKAPTRARTKWYMPGSNLSSMLQRATFKGLNKYGTCFASQSPRPPPRWPGRGHLEYGIPISGRLEDGKRNTALIKQKKKKKKKLT
ncbi:hypothetical protein NQ318_015926 [Aromia moschata]|uniref:Uncharacterized protein n=1 Tax=Aromia moschata TaxID=1265417 RepID=A0AAV8XT22_9CUCU|nr:hypothetical protein NQ318_015926 [Aromia moschata]